MGIWSLLTKKIERSPAREGPWPDDLEIARFGQDVFSLAEAKQGICIFGENGSGKTSGSGRLFARKFLEKGFGGLVLCFKSGKDERDDDAKLWLRYLREMGRESDARIFSATGDLRFNFLEYEARVSGPDFVDNLVTLLMDVASIGSRRGESGVSDATYWASAKEKMLRNAITLLMLAKHPIKLRDIYRLIIDSPTSLAQSQDADWRRESFVFEMLSRASNRSGGHPEYDLIKDFWLRERAQLPDKTKATIEADITGMCDPLTRGKIGELLCTTTNISPDDIFAGRVVIIDLPVAKYRKVGQHAALIWAQTFQRAVDRRQYAAPDTRPVFLWEDEAHWFTIDQDAMFQTTARSKGICVVRLTQNLPNFLDAYGPNGRHKVETLLGNHVLKIWHRNGDPTTNEWASKVIGKQFKMKHALSIGGTEKGRMSASVSEEYQDSCPPHEFVGLTNGGAANDCVVEGIIFQSGRLWQDNRRWTVMKFRQR